MSSLAKSIVRNLFSRKNLAVRRRKQLVGLGMESLENRLLLAADASPWQNQALATDVNNDGQTSITDLAVVVNELIESGGSRQLQTPAIQTTSLLASMSAMSDSSSEETMYYDVNGDKVVSITDLAVIVDQLIAVNATDEAEVTTFTSASSDPTAAGQNSFFVGDTIYVHVFTQDLRTKIGGDELPANKRGIFGMTVDVNYSTEIDLVTTKTPAKTPSDFAVTHGSAFPTVLTGDASVDGLINQLLVTQSFGSRVYSADPMHWVTLEFTATSAGTDLTVDVTDTAGGEVTGLPSDSIENVKFTSTPFSIADSILAVDDSYPDGGSAIYEDGGPFSLDVLDNDSSKNGTLEIISTSNSAAQIDQGSPDKINFTPPKDTHGTFTFDYTISDGTNQSTATVTIDIEARNDAPKGVDDTGLTTDEDTAFDIDAVANDTDIDNDNGDLSASAVDSTSAMGAAISINNDGTLKYDPTGSAQLQALGPNSTAVVDTFTYTVSDLDGLTDTATVSITVSGVNDAPVADDDSATTNEDTAINVNVLTNDDDVDHTDSQLSVSNVDATSSLGVPLSINSDGTIHYDPTLLASLQTMGSADFKDDTFSYTVSDPANGTDTATVTIKVNGVNDAPDAVDNSETINEDITTEFFPLSGDSDVDGGSLVITDVTQGSHGSVTFNSASVTYNPDENYNGNDSFTYTISDGNGGVDTATVNVKIDPVNDGPVAVNDTVTIEENELPGPISIQNSFLTSNDKGGPDNENQSVTVTGVPANGMSDDGGTVVLNANGTISYTAPANFDGEDTFSYTIEDSDGLTATAIATVTERVVNDPPIPVDDDVDAMEGIERNIAASELLTNDAKGPANESDQTLKITAVQTNTDKGGTATLNADGSVSYTPPNSDFNGTDAFTYTVTDDGLTDGVADPKSATATVTVTVTTKNDAPVLVEDQIDATEGEDRVIKQSELLTALDAPGPADESGQSLEVVSVNATTHLGGKAKLNADGTITYSPPDTNVNTPAGELDIIQYTVRDNGQSNGVDDFKTAVSRVKINVQEKNDAPTAKGDTRSTDEDVDLVFNAETLTTNDSQGPDNESDQTLTVTEVATTSAAGGTVSLVNGVITYSPPKDYSGSDSFVYTITDNGTSAGVDDPLTDTATVTITVNPINDAPVAKDDSASGLEDDVITIDALDNDKDIDGDTMTISGVTQGTNGTVSFNGVIKYKPNGDFSGTDTFTYTISDGNGGFDTADVSIEVFAKNDAPTAVDDRAIIEPDQAVLTIKVSDLLSNDLKGPANENGQTLKVTSVDSANGAAVLSQDGQTITYTKPGDFDRSDTFTYTIEDNGQTNGNDDFLTDSATVEVRNFFPSTISGQAFNDINNNGEREANELAIGGRTVTMKYTNIFDEEVTLHTTTLADGTYDFGEVVPGTNVQITMEQPLFLIDGQEVVGTQGGQAVNEMITFDLPEDTNGTGNNFVKLGRMAPYYSVRDFLNTVPDTYAMFAVNPETGEQGWYSFSAGWEDVADAEFSISKDLATISLSVHDHDMNQFETEVPALGNSNVEFLGKIDQWLLIRMGGGFESFAFQTVSNTQAQSGFSSGMGGTSTGQSFSMKTSAASGTGSQSTATNEDSNASAFVNWNADDDDDSSESSSETNSDAVDEALADYDPAD